jgi:DNA-binding GntR family transcriptional regulator
MKSPRETKAKSSDAVPRVRTSLGPDDIYPAVKRMAASYEFKPNERINEIELSKKLSVSRTPLREVLNRLMVEGFLTRTQNKGFIARPLDAQEILSLIEFRRGLEGCIARIACARATDAEIEELEMFSEASFKADENVEAAQLCRLDEEFHMKIARMTRNAEYVRALENVNARIYYVRWLDMENRRTNTETEHQAIVRALKARNPDEVAALIEGHIARRLDHIAEVVQRGFGEIYTRR